MIQEIYPHRFDNSFTLRTAEKTDRVLIYRNDEVLLKDTEQDIIPTFEELGIPAEGADYLYRIDDMYFYTLPPDAFMADKGGISYRNVSVSRTLDSFEGFAIITGREIVRFFETRRFCGRCGHSMHHSDRERAMVCENCGQTEYPKISPAIIVAIHDGDDLLMIKSAGRPNSSFHLIAGFVEIGETFEETVKREAMEEVGVKVKNIKYYKSQPWAFSDSVMIGFTAELDGERQEFVIQESEVGEAAWINRKDIPESFNSISIGSEMISNFKHGRS